MLALCAGAAQAASPAAADGKPVKTCQAGCAPDGPLVPPEVVRAAARDDVLGQDGFYLEADEVVDDQESYRYIARGQVEARYQGRTVRADEVEYRTRTGLVIARGNAQVINADGTIQAADELELDENLSAGVAIGFSTKLGQNIKIAAASAVRRNANVTDLNKAIYTPCPVCSPEGTPKSPTFSIQAERVVQDREKRLIYYRNAVIRVKDIPVFYAPVFFHPDPSAERASGFLVPIVDFGDKRGLSYEQPYYWAISPSQDLTISPLISSKHNPFLNLEYRKRFYSGELQARGGYTFENDFDGNGEQFGEETSRSYILADGEFQLDPNWRFGFTAERTSDDLLFDKYDINSVYEDRGIYLADSRRLISQLYTIRSGPKSYLSVAALSFQGLRISDDDGTFPLVAPLVEGRFEPEAKIAGGRLRVRGSGVVLTRDEGIDSRRATAEADWRRPFTFASGLRLEGIAAIRGDAYSIGDRPAGDTGEESVTRGTATVGVEASYPLIRITERGSVLLEPVVQVLLSPDADDSPEVPNEDSIALTFDETNLYDLNRFPGFDRFEGGQRVNVGGRATWDLGGGREATIFAGRSFRAKEDPQFSANSGLRTKASDYILAGAANPINGVFLNGRARLDSETGEVRRAEANAGVYLSRVQGRIGYLYDDINTRGFKTHELTAAGQVLFTRNWGVTVSSVYDVEESVFRRRDIGLVYQDECTRLDIVYEREETFNRTLGPSESITVRLSLATLGTAGYQDYDER